MSMILQYWIVIPVALKRKFSYKETVMEQIVSKSKIKSYFNYFKSNNPLFKDQELNEQRIDEWIISMKGNIEEEQKVYEILKKQQEINAIAAVAIAIVIAAIATIPYLRIKQEIASKQIQVKKREGNS